jgi:hypothetical protein
MDRKNIIFGRTLNACSPLSTAGGSSGGKDELVSLVRGSLLRVGTDIGGYPVEAEFSHAAGNPSQIYIVRTVSML